jgi:hypothetical protein
MTWFILFLLGTWLFFRLFGRQVLAWGLRFLVRKAEADVQRQREAFEQNYNRTPYGDATIERDGVKVSVAANKKQKSAAAALNEVAEEVDYQEIR